MSGGFDWKMQGLVVRTGWDWWVQDPLLGPVWRAASGLVVAAGPWLIAIVTLVLVGSVAGQRFDAAQVEDLRLSVVYAFMLAPLIAAPVGVLTARSLGSVVPRRTCRPDAGCPDPGKRGCWTCSLWAGRDIGLGAWSCGFGHCDCVL